MKSQNSNNQYLLVFLLVLTSTFIQAQDFMMQGWFWDYPKTTAGANWADTLDNRAAALGDAGFTYVWLPPLSRASFGNSSNGYDPKDLYDLGNAPLGATGFGTRAELDQLISTFNSNGIKAVADVVYNHRDGGLPEDNPAVEGWIENLSCANVNAGSNAYPSDRFRCYLPLGGSSGNGAGTYYFKFRSASKHPNYYNKEYKLYMQTNTTGYMGLPAEYEDESGGGNGGGDCGQGNNTIQLGVDMHAYIDDIGNCGAFCGIDEFQLAIGASDYNPAGDTLWIFMNNPGGDYSDHYILGLWDGSADIQSQIKYQTYTDFTNMPSGRGGMDYTYFKPNGNPTSLEGDWDWMWFFYDYDQRYQQATKDTLNVWTKWLWEDVGIRGFRMDAVKHFNHEFTGDLMDYLHDNAIDPGMVVGEFFDSNPSTLYNWATSVESYMDADTKSAIDVRVFDFSLRESLKNACDNGDASHDVRNIYNTGIVNGVSGNSYNVVTFVNNHDFRYAGQAVQNDPMLAYVYLLSNNQVGLPCVFYPDYFSTSIPNAPTVFLQDQIDTLIAIHKEYIFGSSSVNYLNDVGSIYGGNYISGSANKTLLYQLSGGAAGREVVVAINFSYNDLKLDHDINTSNLMPGDTLYDMLGRSNFPYAIVSPSNQIYVDLPPRSYSVWINTLMPPLPVELGNFTALAKNDKVLLEWQSFEEFDFAGYEIQRSTDGKDFVKIGWLDAKKASIYQFTDRTPPYNSDLYYRLKLIDLDGQFEYSKIATVHLQKAISSLKLFPNPGHDQTVLSFDSQSNGFANIELYDLQGTLQNRQQLTFTEGSNAIDLNLEALPRGVYFLKFKTAHDYFIKRLIKQ